MRQAAAAPNSGLPSLMMPCPACAGRMVYHGRRTIAADLEDTVYACRNCGAELVRTSVRSATSPAKTKPAAAA
jgi:DNA-directed RNA polymerase subunit RPC12/RpoP